MGAGIFVGKKKDKRERYFSLFKKTRAKSCRWLGSLARKAQLQLSAKVERSIKKFFKSCPFLKLGDKLGAYLKFSLKDIRTHKNDKMQTTNPFIKKPDILIVLHQHPIIARWIKRCTCFIKSMETLDSKKEEYFTNWVMKSFWNFASDSISWAICCVKLK